VCRTSSAYNTSFDELDTRVTVKTWLDAAVQDAERRGLAALKPLLETFARATSALRTADWNDDASGELEAAKDADER
jgi:hypothetical protein